MRISNLILFDYPRDPKGHGTAASRRWSPAVQLFYKTLLRRCRCLAHNFCPRRSPFSWQQYQLSLLSLWFSQIASSQIFPVWFPKSTTLYSYIYISYMYIVHLFKKKLRTCAQNRAFQSLLRERVADSVKAASTRCFWCLGTDFCSPWISPWISDIDIGKIWWRYPLVN